MRVEGIPNVRVAVLIPRAPHREAEERRAEGAVEHRPAHVGLQLRDDRAPLGFAGPHRAEALQVPGFRPEGDEADLVVGKEKPGQSHERLAELPDGEPLHRTRTVGEDDQPQGFAASGRGDVAARDRQGPRVKARGDHRGVAGRHQAVDADHDVAVERAFLLDADRAAFLTFAFILFFTLGTFSAFTRHPDDLRPRVRGHADATLRERAG